MSLLGSLLAFGGGCLIFFGAPQLSNYNVEEYLLMEIFFVAGAAGFIAYRLADSRKLLHALIVAAAVCVLPVIFLFALVLFFFLVVCGDSPCKIIPF